MFLAIAGERNLTRAAARLGVSQSALSHSTRRLEAKLGLRLLTRTTRSVSPTVAGERLRETLQPVLDDVGVMLCLLTAMFLCPSKSAKIERDHLLLHLGIGEQQFNTAPQPLRLPETARFYLGPRYRARLDPLCGTTRDDVPPCMA
jgi:hypothetical protein